MHQAGHVFFDGLLFSGRSSEPFVGVGSNGKCYRMVTRKGYTVKKVMVEEAVLAIVRYIADTLDISWAGNFGILLEWLG